VPSEVEKKLYVDVRNKYKNMLLAVQYGMGTETLSARLGISSIEAHQMLNQHRELFPQYWQWSDDWLQAALQTGIMRTAFGWTCRTGILEFNERSIRNWPIQATGAEILRIACILMVRHGIKLLAPIHDAVLIESSLENIEKDVALARECMRRASRIVLNKDRTGTHELRTDYKIIRWPDHYSDPRGEGIWVRVLELLEQHRGRPFLCLQIGNRKWNELRRGQWRKTRLFCVSLSCPKRIGADGFQHQCGLAAIAGFDRRMSSV
jgi:hypothetical protein